MGCWPCGEYLASQGIFITDIDRMAKVNPAKLLRG